MGNCIRLEPRLRLIPGNAAVGQGPPKQRNDPESRPFAAKVVMSAFVPPGGGGAARMQFTSAWEADPAAAAEGQPYAAPVELIAAKPLATFRKLASPTWFTSMPSSVCVLTLRR